MFAVDRYLAGKISSFCCSSKPIKENEIKNNHTNTPVVLV